MRHQIAAGPLGRHGHSMARAVESCIHCGYCLPTCPTYRVLGEEMDSPRGRIVLMKEALEGSLQVGETLTYVDRCLGCLACVTACPSGVEYGQLLSPYRAGAEQRRSRSGGKRLTRALLRETLPYPRRFLAAARLGRLARPFSAILPRELRPMLALLPDSLPARRALPEVYPAEGPRRARVAFLEGCVQQVLAPEMNWATLRVLARNGVEVVIPKDQGCCGALMLHMGEEERGLAQARHNMVVFPKDVDAVVTNAAGCGSAMKEYGDLFAGHPEEREAAEFTARVKDVTEFLAELGIQTPRGLPDPLTVAYHDACHLAHAQGITAPPRALLGAVPNLKLVEIPDGEICCGSAGSYNIEQPQIADRLGQLKAANIMKTGAQAVVAGNIGCIVQMRTYLRRAGAPLPVYHTIELLDLAYRGEAAPRQ
jgi:glycolate oxidase iron-sulfur subunit